jgi:signal transduction histidine kinase
VKNVFNALRSGSFASVYTNYWVTRNQEERLIEWNNSVILDEHGEFRYVVSIGIDVTEKDEVEAELRNHREQLEVLVAERTRELNNAQDELLRKERMATLGQLTATVSHELRNPLSVLKTSLYVIREYLDEENKRAQDAMDRVDRNIQRCDYLVDELLDYTRIQLHEVEVHDFDEWLKSTIDEHAAPSTVEIQQDFSLAGIAVRVDEHRLHRAVLNVLENAFHAVENVDGRMPKIGIMSRYGEDERIEIVIEDNGCGMSEEVKARIFEPLYSTKSFGVGLGMSVVRQIMQQHDGDIVLDSEPGKGTRVVLWLPPSRVIAH